MNQGTAFIGQSVVPAIVPRNEITPGPELKAILDRFLSSLDVKKTSRETYRRALRQFLIWLEAKGITSPDRSTILEFRADLESRGLSPPSRAVYIVAVRRFFEWAEGVKLYPNIARGIKTAKNGRSFKKDPLTIEQLKSLLSVIDRGTLAGKRDYALLNLLFRTGLRTIESIRVDVEDIRQQGGEALLWIQGKGADSKDQFVVLTSDTLQPIYEYLLARGESKTGPLFASISDRNNGGRLTTRSIRRIVKERFRAIGIDSDRLTAHSLRHTAITLSLMAGATIQEAQALGRHANINTTLIYAHNIDRLKNAPERKIAQLLNGEIPGQTEVRIERPCMGVSNRGESNGR